MSSKRLQISLGIVGALAGTIAVAAHQALPTLGANGLLHPGRRSAEPAVRDSHPTLAFSGAGVTLAGWKVPARAARRGTVVYLHGVADNRGSGLGAVERFRDRGFDVIAYDSRAHGDSGGTVCTYGFYEKRDLQRVLDSVESGPVVVIGTSLGAAVGLQAAADDRRISAVVAVESFSDLRTVATERAPWFFTGGVIRQSFALAEELGQFPVDEVSPMSAGLRIRIPVLLIHGSEDTETPPEHSRQILGLLHGPKQLLIVDGAGHNESLQPWVWSRIEAWIDAVLDRGGDSD